jgi:hypothetical protein
VICRATKSRKSFSPHRFSRQRTNTSSLPCYTNFSLGSSVAESFKLTPIIKKSQVIEKILGFPGADLKFRLFCFDEGWRMRLEFETKNRRAVEPLTLNHRNFRLSLVSLVLYVFNN